MGTNTTARTEKQPEKAQRERGGRFEPDFDQLTERDRIELEQRFTDLRASVRHLQASSYSLSGHMWRPNSMLQRARIANELETIETCTVALRALIENLPLSK